MAVKKLNNLSLDFNSNKPLPDWVREVIDTHLAIEQEDAKSAGALGFMARALVIATMPYKDPKSEIFVRTNGDFRLRMVSGSSEGLPFGIYPRLLMSWVATEAVRKESPVIELGDSLRTFLRDVLELRSNGGGTRGSSTRVTNQMKRLFSSMITAEYAGEKKGFSLRNVLIAEDVDVSDEDAEALDAFDSDDNKLWTPQAEEDAGKWRSSVRLSNRFFQECITSPVPIDLRAYKALRGSPLAMDVYTWLTYRLSYTQRRTKPIPWESLMYQFGSGFNLNDLGQAVRNFRKAFLQALNTVLIVYPQAQIELKENGIVLLPSRTHVLPNAPQGALF
jgi:hypothetical protein